MMRRLNIYMANISKGNYRTQNKCFEFNLF